MRNWFFSSHSSLSLHRSIAYWSNLLHVSNDESPWDIAYKQSRETFFIFSRFFRSPFIPFLYHIRVESKASWVVQFIYGQVYFSTCRQINMTPQIQKAAPDFKGTAVVNGQFKEIKLSDYKGKYLVSLKAIIDLLEFSLKFSCVSGSFLLSVGLVSIRSN